MTADTDLRSRQADLAAQLAAEVRAGRPERARLMAYCGSPEARHSTGWPTISRGRQWSECEGLASLLGDEHEHFRPRGFGASGTIPEDRHYTWCPGSLRYRYPDPRARLEHCLTGLQRVAWTPLANVDPAQWVLAVAACAVARAVDATFGVNTAAWRDAMRAIEAAEAWTRCPCEACRLAVREHWTPSGPEWIRGVVALLGPGETWREHADWTATAAAQILGPDATREAAARGVLEAL